MSQIRTIISDADGTLVNTLFLIRHGQYEAAVEYLIKREVPYHHIPEYEVYEKIINKSVGGNTRETFEKTLRKLFDKANAHILNQIDFDELDSSLAPIQDRLATLYVHPFHGLTELFTWLGSSKTNFGIFTSGNRRMIIRNFGVSLPVLGHTDLFRLDDVNIEERLSAFIARSMAVYGMPKLAVITCEEVAKTKPDPEGILKLIEQLQAKLDETLVIGDHPADMQAAQAAGLHAVGISHGFSTSEELLKEGAVSVIDDLASLPKAIEAHNNGKKLLF